MAKSPHSDFPLYNYDKTYCITNLISIVLGCLNSLVTQAPDSAANQSLLAKLKSIKGILATRLFQNSIPELIY